MTPDGELAKLFVDAGYQIAELPEWFGATARASADVVDADVQDVDADVQDVQTGDVHGEGAEEMVYPARTPLSREQVQPGVYQPPSPSTGSPPSTSVRTPPPSPSTTPPSDGRLTPGQTQLLAQQGITYDEGHHTWVKVIPQGKGQYVEAVDPIATLRVLEAEIKSEQERVNMAAGIADDLLDTVKLQTQAILKKVALNPSVFQCYQYVSNGRDPATNKVLFSGDFGDYISWAVIFATRVFYGVEPMFQINLPSIYTRHKRRRSDAEHMAQTTPPQMQAAPPMLNYGGNVVGYSSLPQTYSEVEEDLRVGEGLG